MKPEKLTGDKTQWVRSLDPGTISTKEVDNVNDYNTMSTILQRYNGGEGKIRNRYVHMYKNDISEIKTCTLVCTTRDERDEDLKKGDYYGWRTHVPGEYRRPSHYEQIHPKSDERK